MRHVVLFQLHNCQYRLQLTTSRYETSVLWSVILRGCHLFIWSSIRSIVFISLIRHLRINIGWWLSDYWLIREFLPALDRSLTPLGAAILFVVEDQITLRHGLDLHRFTQGHKMMLKTSKHTHTYIYFFFGNCHFSSPSPSRMYWPIKYWMSLREIRSIPSSSRRFNGGWHPTKCCITATYWTGVKFPYTLLKFYKYPTI